MSLFQKSVLNKYLLGLEKEKVDKAWVEFQKLFHDKERQQIIREANEEKYQSRFLNDLFVKVLGYTQHPDPNHNLVTEQKNESDAGKADGALLDEGKIKAVIELKGTNTVDLDKIVDQGFRYKHNQSNVRYVIISNYEKLRFYIDDAVENEEFDLFRLTRERFNVLWLCLEYSNFVKDIPKKIKDSSLVKEEQITKKLYKDYSDFRKALHQDLIKRNSNYDKLILFKKTQKLLDRFLFIFFAEDRGLIPPNFNHKIIRKWTELRDDYDLEVSLYDRFKKNFEYLNEGYKGKEFEVFAYNGGLFNEDKVLDNLIVSDAVLYEYTDKLSEYDFVSDVDVNILGHIFEHSLNEIEEINAELKGQEVDTSKTRRKKDGVFYTPKYITKYIVGNTVGKLCKEQKAKFEIEDEDYRPNRQKKTKKELLNKLEQYRAWLLDLTICDPACGSGAFLNQALEFLIDEHSYVDELQAKLLGESMVLPEVENQILERNLFGVDINEESVEIAKLSLWLRTAQKGRKLTSLNNHIKCGNSLIDDPEVAGDKAFTWEEEFPDVFANGGFDVVIGNPPYVPTEFIAEKEKEYLENIYDSAFGRINLYPIFYEKGIQILKEKGLLSFITPYTILKNQYYKEARKYILENTSIVTLVDFKGTTVFTDAAVDSIILVLSKSSVPDNKYNQIFNIRDFKTLQYDNSEIVQDNILNSDDLSFNVSLHEKLIKRISKKCVPLSKVIDFNQGIITGANKKFITTEKGKLTKKVITGRDFVRYYVFPTNNYVIYDTDELHRSRKKEIFEVDEKILLRQTSAYPICALDTKSYYTLDTVHNGLIIDDNFDSKYLLSILNSNLFRFLYENSINETGKVFAQVKIIYMDPLPIKLASDQDQKLFSKKVDQITEYTSNFESLRLQFINLLLSKFDIDKLSRKLQNWHELTFKQFLKELKKKKVKLPPKESAEWMEYFNQQEAEADDLKSQIAQTDKEIDAMVHELYGLTDEETAVVEESFK